MKAILAAVVLVGLLVRIADADDSTLTPENDVRLARVSDAPPQKIGVLSYYRNTGGGYTFMEGHEVAFVALPYLPITTTYNAAQIVDAKVKRRVGPVTIASIGRSRMSFGGQTFYRSQMTQKAPGLVVRDDIPIATLLRDTPDGKSRFSIVAEDSETRMKLKSIVPVLETALLADEKSPAHKPAVPIMYEASKSKAGTTDYVFFQNGQRIAYSDGFDLFLCPSSNINPPLKTDTLILEAGHKGGRGWMPAYQRLQPRPFTVAQQEEIVNLLGGGRDPTDTGKRHQLTTDSVVRIVEPDIDPPPLPK